MSTDPLLDEATRLADGNVGPRAAEAMRALVERVQAAEADRDRLKRGGATLGKALDDALWDVAKATRSTELLDETRDGDWGLIFDRLATLGDRAETAEAERDQYRADTVRAERSEDEARGKLDKVRGLVTNPPVFGDLAPARWYGAADMQRDVLAILDGKDGRLRS